MELLVRGEDPESEDGRLLVKVEAELDAVRASFFMNHVPADASVLGDGMCFEQLVGHGWGWI